MKKLIVAIEKLNLTTKLLLGFGVCLLITLLIGINSINSLRVMDEEAQTIYEKDLLGISHLKEANINLIYMGRSLRQMMLSSNAAEREKARAKIDLASLTLQKEMSEARKRIFRAKNLQLIDEFENRFEQYRHNVNQAILLLDKEGFRQSDAVAFISSAEFMDVVNTADNLLSEISRNKEEGAREAAEALAKLSAQSRELALVLMLAGLAIGGIFGVVLGRSILKPAERMRTSIEGLAAVKLDDPIPHTDYPNEIGAMARAIRVLQDVCRGMEAQRWVKTNVAEISAELQQAENFVDLSQKFMLAVCPLLNVGQGVFYIHAEGQLRMLGSYGYRERKNLGQHFAIGEGLVGQCAMEKTPITLTDPPQDYIKIGSGLGEASPKMIAVLPILHQDQVAGVLELASFQPFSERETALLDAMMPVLAMTMQILERNIRTQRLLKETQEQATRMETQAAQLEEQSVEMEAQQAELMQTEAWYRSIVEAAPDAMLVVNEQGTIILCNPKAEAIFGYEASELTGQNVDSLVPLKIRADHPKMRASFMATGGSRTMGAGLDLKGVRKDGTEFPVEVGLSSLPDIGGRGVCVCAAVRDMTERK